MKKKGQVSLEMMLIYGFAIIIALVAGFILFNFVKNAQKSVGTSLGNNLNTAANFVATPLITSASITGNLLTAKITFDNGNPAIGMNLNNFLINGTNPTDVTSVNNTYNMTVPACDIDFVVLNTNNGQQSEKIINNCVSIPPAILQINSILAINNAGTNLTTITTSVGYNNGTGVSNLINTNFLVNGTVPAVGNVTGNNPYTITTDCITTGNDPNINAFLINVTYQGQMASQVNNSSGFC